MKANPFAPPEAQATLVELLDNAIDKFWERGNGATIRPHADWVDQEMRRRARRNVEVGGLYVESPLEWAGFFFLIGVLTVHHALAVRVHPPDYGPDAVDRWEEDRVNTIARWRDAMPEGSNEYEDLLRAAIKIEGESPEAEQRLLEHLPGLPPTVHVVMQHTFRDLQVDGKTVRPDMVLLIPERGSRYVFEFDGYNFHNSEEAFAHDRRRDRALDSLGYRVRRFPYRDLASDAARYELTMEFSAFLDKQREGWMLQGEYAMG